MKQNNIQNNIQEKQGSSGSGKAFFMIAFPLLFFVYQFVLRMWMGQIQHSEMTRLHLDAQGFGLISTFYYAGYTLFQIPMALLFARYSSKIVLFLASFVTLVFFFLGLFAPSLPLALLCRFIVGMGSVAGILGLSKIVSLWIEKKRYGSVFGLTISLGLCGLPLGQSPVAYGLEIFGVKTMGLFLVAIGVVLSLGTLLFLQEPSGPQRVQEKSSSESSGLNLKDLKGVLFSFPLWAIGITSLLLVGTLQGLADVWGSTFLTTVHHFKPTTAALCMSFSFFGLIAGTTIIPFIGERIGHFGTVVLSGIFLTLFSLGFIYGPPSSSFISFICFMLGIFSGYQTNLFSFGENYKPKNIGPEMVVAFVNCINMAGGSFFHWGIPMMMNYGWKKAAQGQSEEILKTMNLLGEKGETLYTLSMYQQGLLFVSFSALVGTVLFFLLFYKKK